MFDHLLIIGNTHNIIILKKIYILDNSVLLIFKIIQRMTQVFYQTDHRNIIGQNVLKRAPTMETLAYRYRPLHFPRRRRFKTKAATYLRSLIEWLRRRHEAAERKDDENTRPSLSADSRAQRWYAAFDI